MNELQDHINDENKKDIDQLYKHADVANREMGTVKVDLAQVKSDVSWLVKTYWVILGSSVGSLLAGIIALLFK